MSLDWKAIRPLNGSQAEGFEELCAQLARAENSAGARFQRKGAPDAGVECYSILPDGSEWGWQAKYFDVLSDSQWAQLDKSVKTALGKHPSLVRYFVCVPLDRPDARIERQRSAMQRWDDHVEKWEAWAQDRDKSVQFVWWGSSELLERLSRSEHIGRVHFWFGERGFDEAWFRARLDEALRAAGPRYTPEVHVGLPIARELEMFSRTDSTFDEIKSLARGIRKELQHVGSSSSTEEDASRVVPMDGLLRAGDSILGEFAALEPTPVGELPFGSIAEKVASAESMVEKLAETLSELAREHDTQHSKEEGRSRYRENPFTQRCHRIYRLQSGLREAHSVLCHADEITNSRLMILNGAAGTGKTHLLCDAARRRVAAGAPTLLLMGQRFVSTDAPWSQVLQHLDLPGISAETFVGALEAAAQAARCRALLLIDAINEGQGRAIWPANLAAFLALLEKSPWIGVLLSVRSTYEEVVIPEDVRSRAVAVTHHGFDDHEYDATRTFFSFFGLELPSTPILQPEFRNPLFLKTICRGLRDEGKRRVPRGFHGITAAFELYLRAINIRLAEALGFNPNDELVGRALESFAQHLVETDERWLPRPKAEDAVNGMLPGREFERSLYRGLVAEGVLVEEIAWPGEDPCEEVVFISYERFADHVIADLLLQTHLDANSPEAAFAEEGGLAFICEEKRYIPPGLIEALCIQVPERVGEELVKLAPGLVNRWGIGDAFRQSVVWRRLDAFSESTREVLNEVIRTEHDWNDTLDVLLTVATLEDHPFNAEFLDKRLHRNSMPDRDSWWSTFLHGAWGTRGAVDRLVDWASGVSANDDLHKGLIELCSIALAWMLTTSNRSLRDRATKALVSLLTGRLDSAARLVDRFCDVDDPYIAERIYAVAYGVAMRSNDPAEVGALAARVYDRVFGGGAPPAHILLRDYARGVIERAICLGSEFNVDEQLIRPPYTSTWPKIPDEDEIRPLMPDWSQGSHDSGEAEWARNRIGSSVMDDDFARYVIGTNSSSMNWLSLRLDEEPWQSPDARLKALLPTLEASERLAWERYKETEEAVPQLVHLRWFRELTATEGDEDPSTEGEGEFREASEEDHSEIVQAEQALEAALGRLRSTLTEDHRTEVDAILLARSEGGGERPPRFDLKLIQRYVLWRVFDLGWTTERFGHFDRFDIRSHGREASKRERIGKKYQWIAYHEMLAYIADHYQYREWYREDEGNQAYEGTWQEFLRDIDPSCTLSSTPGGTSWGGHSSSWWGRSSYAAWDEGANHRDWVSRENDIPDVADLLSVAHPKDESRWLNVQGYFNWQQPHPADVESTDVDRRDLWLLCTGYFLRAEDTDAFMSWAEGVDFWGRWMPSPPEVHHMFLGEYGWSPAFRYFNQPYHGADGWTNPGHGCPVPLITAAFEYASASSGLDCSVDDHYTLRLPVYEFVDRVGFKWAGRGADYLDLENRVVAFDPTVHEVGPAALLLREDFLRQYLSREGLALCWSILGQKLVLGRGFGSEYHGALRMSGAYAYGDGEPEGFLNFHHDDPGNEIA